MSPISAWILNDSARLNFGFPFAAGGFSFFSASVGADALAFAFFKSSYLEFSSFAASASFFTAALDLVNGLFLLAEFSRDYDGFLSYYLLSSRLLLKVKVGGFINLLMVCFGGFSVLLNDFLPEFKI